MKTENQAVFTDLGVALYKVVLSLTSMVLLGFVLHSKLHFYPLHVCNFTTEIL